MARDMSITETYINDIVVAKTNMRKMIDCDRNSNIRDNLFEHYEGLCRRLIKIKNDKESLYYKKKMFEAELKRCTHRSKRYLILYLFT